MLLYIRTNHGLRFFTDRALFDWALDTVASFGPNVRVLAAGQIG